MNNWNSFPFGQYTVNRTSVELKLVKDIDLLPLLLAFNRTMMESKCSKESLEWLSNDIFNRTIIKRQGRGGISNARKLKNKMNILSYICLDNRRRLSGHIIESISFYPAKQIFDIFFITMRVKSCRVPCAQITTTCTLWGRRKTCFVASVIVCALIYGHYRYGAGRIQDRIP